MRFLTLILCVLLTACGPNWALRSIEDGWTTYYWGKTVEHRRVAPSRTQTTRSFKHSGTAIVWSRSTVGIRSRVPYDANAIVYAFQRGHLVGLEFKGMTQSGWYLWGSSDLSLELPPGTFRKYL